MEHIDLLDKILAEPMDKNLRFEVLRNLFLNTGKRKTGIPRLKNCQNTLNCDMVFYRMKTAAGGTCASIAEVLGITKQGVSNQIYRKAISGNSIIDFHLKTGISVDWLIGSWEALRRREWVMV